VKLGLFAACVLRKYWQRKDATSSVMRNFTVSKVILFGQLNYESLVWLDM